MKELNYIIAEGKVNNYAHIDIVVRRHTGSQLSFMNSIVQWVLPPVIPFLGVGTGNKNALTFLAIFAMVVKMLSFLGTAKTGEDLKAEIKQKRQMRNEKQAIEAE